ncbi:MAG: prolyl oligopeptidase family serine peptidase [Pyrinomonadaceae bacterium]
MRVWIDRRAIFSSIILAAFAVSQFTVPGLLAQSPSPGQAQFNVDDVLSVKNVSMADLSDDGRWAAVIVTSLNDRIGINNHRFGDPTYTAPSLLEVFVIETETAKTRKVFSDKRQVRGLAWSPDGNQLAMLVLKGDVFEPVIWERSTGKLTSVPLPHGKQSTDNTSFQWSPDSKQVLFTVRTDEWQRKAAEKFRALTSAPVVVQSSKDPFLGWDDLRRLSSVRSLVAFDIKKGNIREVLPETKLVSFNLSEDGSFITLYEDITKKTDYDEIFGSESQVQLIRAAGGEKRTLVKSTKGLNLSWSRDGRWYGYAKEGKIFVASIDDKEPRQLTGKKPEAEKGKTDAVPDKPKDDVIKDSEKEKKEAEQERFSLVRLSPKGDRLVASNKEGLWIIETSTGVRELIVKMPEEDKEGPRYQVVDWDKNGEILYFSLASRTKWERGLIRYDLRSKKMEDVLRDGRLYNGFTLSGNGSTVIFNSAEGNRPGDLYAVTLGKNDLRRLTQANPKLTEKRLGKTELIPYLDADGNKTYGVLYYPADYQPGQKVPTIFNIYEQFFDDNFNGAINVLTSNGYAVMQPSVSFDTGYPGEAWIKGVTAAANKLIDMGIADPERLGVQGVSYGGYATNLLITQTNRFKAAINISGKVNMISFYTDSPRLGVRNIHAPEKSQDRIGATLWQQPQKYIQQSAIMFADRIKTPLLLITGEQDHNVPARQAMEMYYALRRLGKEVEWVSYTNGGHGMPTTTVEEVKDYHTRIIKWYDDHLKGDLKKKAEERKSENSAQ